MKLTESQIEDLYAFTRNHFVEYYDLQTELVDHMANDIESILKENPKISYTEAKDKAFKKFGVFGFMIVVEQRQKAMNKTYIKCLLHELKIWFKLPKIILTLVLLLLFYLAFSSNMAYYFFVTFYIALFVWSIYQSIQVNRAYRKRKEISNKKWLLEELIFKQVRGVWITFASQIYIVINHSDMLLHKNHIIFLVAAVFSLLYILNYISFKVLPNKAEKLLAQTYPEFTL